MADIAMQVRVTGQVQGVGFRAWTQATAAHLGLRGWVRNLPNGSVEALLVGPKEAVGEMVTALHAGPGAAEVTQVLREPVTPVPEAAGFAIRG
ncbi:acylphosphatase [Rhodobacteraceae bacterium CCMM004]|nr:acylphosphatase [Rhodobacteraceae bacterium CCMM004]